MLKKQIVQEIVCQDDNFDLLMTYAIKGLMLEKKTKLTKILNQIKGSNFDREEKC